MENFNPNLSRFRGKKFYIQKIYNVFLPLTAIQSDRYDPPWNVRLGSCARITRQSVYTLQPSPFLARVKHATLSDPLQGADPRSSLPRSFRERHAQLISREILGSAHLHVRLDRTLNQKILSWTESRRETLEPNRNPVENRRAKNILSRISAPGDICNYNLNVNLRWIFNEVQKKIFEKIEKYHGCGISDNCYFI